MIFVFALLSGYIVLTYNSIRLLVKIFKAFDDILGRKWAIPHNNAPSLIILLIHFFSIAPIVGFMGLVAPGRVALGKTILNGAKKAPKNQITPQEERDLLRFIDTLKQE